MTTLLHRSLAAGSAAVVLALAVAAPSGAHVTVRSPDGTPGRTGTVIVRVPNESATGAATTALTMQLDPSLKSVRAAVIPGWTSTIDRRADGTPASVTWTTAPGSPGIGPGQYGDFAVAVAPYPDRTVALPATQSYSDGTQVRWDQPTAADGTEPEHPSPVLTPPADTAAAASGAADTAHSAWILSGVSLAVAALAAALAFRRGGRGRA